MRKNFDMKKVIIIGGGFSGAHIARELEKDFDVILIDSKDYFEFTPGILRTIVEPEHIKKIQILHTHYLKRAKVIVGCVKTISESYVVLDNNKRIRFDYLAICSGSSYNVPFKEENIIKVTRAKNLRECYDKLCKSKRILIIGGGLVGVELAAEICTHYKGKEIIIIHAKDRLMERTHENAIKYAENFLKRKGIKIIYGERAEKKHGNIYITNKKREIETDMAFLCTGITPNYDFMEKNFKAKLNQNGFIKVNEHLQLEGYTNIFAIGDVNDRAEEKTAQNAERQARIAVKNIIALEKNASLTQYHSKRTPLVISLGKYNGIFDTGKFVLTGPIPGLLKSLIEKREMWKLRRS